MYRETRGWKATGESGVTEKLKWLGVTVMETAETVDQQSGHHSEEEWDGST